LISTTGITQSPGSSRAILLQTNLEGLSRSEQQLLRTSGVYGGTWRVAYGDKISGSLPFGTSSQELERILNDFVEIDKVTVVGGPSQFMVTFGGTQYNTDMAPIRVDRGNLTGGTPLRTITLTTNCDAWQTWFNRTKQAVTP